MSKSAHELIYAVKDNQIVSIKDVESGLQCGCTCPCCHAQLIARKGAIRKHHFAHYKAENCEYGYETSLHLAAKAILSEAKEIMIPPVYVEFNSYKEKELVRHAMKISVDRVELEKRFDDVIPDVVIYSGGKLLFVEIYVTHAIDKEKLEKLKREHISTIEIDLSQRREDVTEQELREILLGDSEEKSWKYNACSEGYLQDYYQVADYFRIVERGLALHVDYCPISTRKWRGKPYANVMDDCIYCPFCISVTLRDTEDQHILCAGRHGVNTLQDLKKAKQKELQGISKDVEDESPKRKKCPWCGCYLIRIEGEYGPFWRCTNRNGCRYIKPIKERRKYR